jgi:hypothetical protein
VTVIMASQSDFMQGLALIFGVVLPSAAGWLGGLAHAPRGFLNFTAIDRVSEVHALFHRLGM